MANTAVASLAHKLLPILDWIPGYRREWLLPDVFAGVALWAVMVPEGMAYAGIVGVPPIMGLYTIVPALLAYALLGTSRQISSFQLAAGRLPHLRGPRLCKNVGG